MIKKIEVAGAQGGQAGTGHKGHTETWKESGGFTRMGTEPFWGLWCSLQYLSLIVLQGTILEAT